MSIFGRISNLRAESLNSNFFSNKNYFLFFCLILTLAVLLRLPLLNGSFWLDEAAQALEVVRPLSQQLDIAADFQPPLYHLLLHFWQYAGHQEWWLRLVSLIAGIGSILVSMKIAEKWQGRAASLWVGLLLATSSLHIFFSQELRPYMLAVWWGSLSLAFYLDLVWPTSPAINLKKNLRFRKTSLILFAIVNTLGALTSYVFLFWLFGLLITTWLLHFKQAWLIAKSLAVSGIWWLIWLPGLLSQLAASSALRAAVPGWEGVVSLSQLKAIPLTMAKFIIGNVPVDFGWQDILIVIIPLISITIYGAKDWHSQSSSAKKQSLTLIYLFGFSLLAGWLFSFWTPVISPKRVLFLLPVFYLIFTQVWQHQTRSNLTIIISFLLFTNLISLGRYWTDPALHRENWRQAVQIIEQRYSPANSIVVFGFDAPFAPWVWYQAQDTPTRSTGFKPIISQSDAQQRLDGISKYENVILFDYLLDLSDPQKQIGQVIKSKGYDESEVLDFAQLGFIRVFRQQKLYAQQD